MRVMAMGDIGVLDDMIHIGDEAMFEAGIGELRARGVHDIVGVSANPQDTAARYGIDAVERPNGAPSADLIETLRGSDAVIITGGGNLSSLWPMHVRTRSEIGRLARQYEKPLVVTGQTIGPYLDEADSALVAELLGSARLVGVREARSRELCQRLGIPASMLRQTVDDASFLVTEPAEPSPYCLVTLAHHVGDADRSAVELSIAALLNEVGATTDLTIAFSAHFGALDGAPTLGPARGDSIMHERVAALLSAPAQVLPVTDSAAAARLARSAALVVCSRYHPAVFAASAGVPVIGIPVDDYTETKLTGALANFGQHSTLPVAALLAGAGNAVMHETWAARRDTRATGLRLAASARQASARWWDDVVAALGGQS